MRHYVTLTMVITSRENGAAQHLNLIKISLHCAVWREIHANVRKVGASLDVILVKFSLSCQPLVTEVPRSLLASPNSPKH